ncbi:MAG: LOG family protein, partial [Planctomycetota bacterium]
ARAELMHADVADMRVTRDMHERKATMHELSDVYVTLPGGFGTMEELFEAVTWAQLELHARPVFLLNLQGLYDGLVDMIDSMKHRGFLSPRCHSLLIVATSEEQLCRLLDDALSGV